MTSGLVDLLERHGFVRAAEQAGKGSGGPFDSVTFAKGDRELRLWRRADSVAVTYRIGDDELDHATYMSELLGPGGPNRFPAYAGDADRALAALQHDLEEFCGDFLDGSGDDLRRCARADKVVGLKRLARVEEQLGR